MSKTAENIKLLLLTDEEIIQIGKLLYFMFIPSDKKIESKLFVDNYSPEAKRFVKDNFCIYFSKDKKEIVAMRIYNAIFDLNGAELVLRSGALLNFQTGELISDDYYIKHEIQKRDRFGTKCQCVKSHYFLPSRDERDLYMVEYKIKNENRVPFWICLGCGGWDYAT